MKKTYKIDVDCANCANLVEAAAAKVPGVDVTAVMKNVVKAARKVEPDCEIFL